MSRGDFASRMLASSERRKSRVVLALDISGPYETRLRGAESLLHATKDAVCAVKVNQHLLLPFGLEGLRAVAATCRDSELPLIADLKLNDIGSTNVNAVESLLHYGFDAVIANPFVGREEGLEEAIVRMHEGKGGVLLLVYMSHRGANDGYGLRIAGGEPLYRVFARRAREWGADGVVVSAKAPSIIKETRELVGEKCLIFSPGVGAQGGTSRGAGGADFVIVGRSIVEARDPVRALRALEGT